MGSENPSALALSLGYAYRFGGGCALGLAAKWIQEYVATTAHAEALDLGFLSPPMFDQRLRWGLSVSNAGTTLNFDGFRENLPLTARFGGAFRLSDRWLLAADAVAPRGGAFYAGIGTEYRFLDIQAWSFAVRGGYDSRTSSSGLGFSGAAFGVGIGYKGLTLDYALVPMGSLGQTQRISLSNSF